MLVKPFIDGLSPRWTTYLTSRLHAYQRRKEYLRRIGRPRPVEEALKNNLVQNETPNLPEHADEIPPPETGLMMSMARYTRAMIMMRQYVRRYVAKTELRHRKENMLRHNTLLALSQHGFFETAGDVMVNMVFNLMQEAAYEEFPIDAEPVQFMSKVNPSAATAAAVLL